MKQIRIKRLLVIYGILMLIVFLIVFFQWEIHEVFTPFFGIVLWIVIAVIILGMLAIAVKIAIKFRKHITAYLPLCITVFTAAVLSYNPFTSLYLDMQYLLHSEDMKEVVMQLEKSEDVTNGSLSLPGRFAKLSKGGGEAQQYIDGGYREVLFYSFRGVLSNYAGFLYVSSDDPADIHIECTELKKKEKNWYWISNY